MGQPIKPPSPASSPRHCSPPKHQGACWSVLLADAEAQVRSALALVLSNENGLSVAGEAVCTEDLLSQIGQGAPDILILAWGLPGEPTDGLLARIKSQHPQMRIVVMSGHPQARPGAALAGADAFVSKVESPARLIETIQEMARRLDDR